MKSLAEHFTETEKILAEKAVSQQQQKFMGMVHAMQKGEKVKGASPELKKVARTMGKKDVEDFAKTKHKGLPKKVGESSVMAGVRSVMEARMLDEGGETFEHILNRFKYEVKQFEQGDELDSDLYEALFDYYANTGEMPYGTMKARTGDPYEWITYRFAKDLGLNEAAVAAEEIVEMDPLNLEVPAFKRKHNARLGGLAKLPPSEPIGGVRPENVPAVTRKAAGKNFPVSMDQALDTSDKISHLDTLRKMAGLPPRV